MFSRKIHVTARLVTLAALLLAVVVAPVAAAEKRQSLRIPVGHAEVVASSEDVQTVAIAEPKIADAAVGSQKTVVVNGKSVGTTTLVVYNSGARFSVYDVDVYLPNGEKQVALRATVAEVNTRAAKDLGFDLAGQVTSTVPWLDGTLEGGLFPEKTGPGSGDGFLSYIRTKGDLLLAADWKALEEKGDLRVLANPTVVARHGQKATFLVGGEFPVPIATGGGISTGNAIVQTVTVEWKEFGVRLNVVPKVEDDASVTLEMLAEVSDLDFTTPIRLSGFDIPIIRQRKTTTTVNLKPTEFLVIGGLKDKRTTSTVRRVPLLGHLPLLGALFSSHHSLTTDQDVLFVITPELVAGAATSPALPTDVAPKR